MTENTMFGDLTTNKKYVCRGCEVPCIVTIKSYMIPPMGCPMMPVSATYAYGKVKWECLGEFKNNEIESAELGDD